ncbi:unnamed protein product [Polarella glacialis]|uniref:NADAR domain-containing protein n=1 Tax=Polarella glacialis TaxID=89957 RepID=A0A813L9E4_POLGL|nr:unnamed protein product [Polarella glacialis]
MGKTRAKWDSSDQSSAKVLAFYSDRPGRQWREFSNFYRHAVPFEFRLPACVRQVPGMPDSVWCEFSEKAIMACKAALMGDQELLQSICASQEPKDCKALGRGVRNFDQELWDRHLEEIAVEVVFQKFSSSKELRQVLLSTGHKILAEAAPNDAIWGIGLGSQDVRCQDPTAWLGRNVLGFALMEARQRLLSPECQRKE